MAKILTVWVPTTCNQKMRHLQLAGTRMIIHRSRRRGSGVHLASPDGQLGSLPHAEAAGPSIAPLLPTATDTERIGGDIVSDHRAGSHHGAVPNYHRRHQRRVGADERPGADVGVVLAETIIVAGDGARPDVGPRADTGVADIAQVVDLGSGLDHRLLDLDEVADVDALAQISSRPQAGIRAEGGARIHLTALEVTEALDLHTVADGHARTEHGEGAHRDIAAEPGVVTEVDRAGINQRRTVPHGGLAHALLGDRLAGRQLGAAVDPEEFRLVTFHHDAAMTIGPRQGHRVGEVEFPFGVVIADAVEP